MTETEAIGRSSELGKVHVGKKQLFYDDGDYRDLLQTVAGVRSAGDLDSGSVPAAYAETILQRMCSNPHRVSL